MMMMMPAVVCQDKETQIPMMIAAACQGTDTDPVRHRRSCQHVKTHTDDNVSSMSAHKRHRHCLTLMMMAACQMRHPSNAEQRGERASCAPVGTPMSAPRSSGSRQPT
eukprot:2943754-Rhodomonas_salina.1